MRQLIYLSVLLLVTSCANRQLNFNKQKFTNLRQIDSQPTCVDEFNKDQDSENNDHPLDDVNRVNEDFGGQQNPISIELEDVELPKSDNEEDFVKLETKERVEVTKREIKQSLNEATAPLASEAPVSKHKAKKNVGLGLIGLSIVFLCIGIATGLLSILFLGLGFSGVFFGVLAGICFVLFLVLLILGIARAK